MNLLDFVYCPQIEYKKNKNINFMEKMTSLILEPILV